MGMRKGVPHAKCSPLCAIKEKLQELWDRAYGCINKINDITPDGDGKFEINAGSGIVVSPDGNGIEISAASVSYTGIDPIVVDNDTLEISAPTVAVQDDLAAKADKATSLAGYGITDGVTTNTAQTISATKTHTQPIFLNADNTDPYLNITSNVPRYSGTNPNNLDSTDGMLLQLFGIANNKVYYQADMYRRGSASMTEYHNYVKNKNGVIADLAVYNTDTGDTWAQAPYRAYNSAYTADVVTIGSLAANPSVVHTTGTENILGTKRFGNPIVRQDSRLSTAAPATQYNLDIFQTQDSNGVVINSIYLQYRTDGSVWIGTTARRPDNTYEQTIIHQIRQAI